MSYLGIFKNKSHSSRLFLNDLLQAESPLFYADLLEVLKKQLVHELATSSEKASVPEMRSMLEVQYQMLGTLRDMFLALHSERLFTRPERWGPYDLSQCQKAALPFEEYVSSEMKVYFRFPTERNLITPTITWRGISIGDKLSTEEWLAIEEEIWQKHRPA